MKPLLTHPGGSSLGDHAVWGLRVLKVLGSGQVYGFGECAFSWGPGF